MHEKTLRPFVIGAAGLTVLACSLPWTAGGSRAAATRVVATIYQLQTEVGASPTPTATLPPAPEVPTPTRGAASTPIPTQTPEDQAVAITALCWTGPGSAYPVVSSIKAGTKVRILGVGSVAGWFVVENPIYRDRCWIRAEDLALEPFFNTSHMQVYNPPPTPGPSVTPGPSPTP